MIQKQRWTKEIDSTLAGKLYTSIIQFKPRIAQKPDQDLLSLFKARKHYSAYIQLKTGFRYFKRYLWILKKEPEPIYSYGTPRQNPYYLLFYYPLLALYRRKINKFIDLLLNNLGKLRALFLTKKGLGLLKQFIEEIDIGNRLI